MTLTAQHPGMSLKEADSYVFVPLQTEDEQWIMAWPGTEYLNEWIIALNHFIEKKKKKNPSKTQSHIGHLKLFLRIFLRSKWSYAFLFEETEGEQRPAPPPHRGYVWVKEWREIQSSRISSLTYCENISNIPKAKGTVYCPLHGLITHLNHHQHFALPVSSIYYQFFPPSFLFSLFFSLPISPFLI